MWRAWGTFLFLLSQDSASPFVSEEHEISLRPPSGWTRQALSGQLVARFTPPDVEAAVLEAQKKLPPWGITIGHLRYGTTPQPLQNFIKQIKEKIGNEFKTAKILEEKPLKIGGRDAYRVVFEYENAIQIKTVLPRTNVESYLLDISLLKSDEAKFRKAAEASLETFQIVPSRLTGDEAVAEARATGFLREAKLPAGILGEQWHSIYLFEKRVGHYRTLVTESNGTYLFEIDVQGDFGEGNTDSTTVRGSFTPDGRVQKIETRNTKTGEKKERWENRASVTIEGGRLKASRDMEGVKEEKSFPVADGVLLTDVADFLRRALVGAPKGSYVFKTISPYSDESGPELIEVNAKDTMELDGKRREAHVLFSRVDRRRNMTYYVAPDGGLVRAGGMRDAFSVRASTKEEALAPVGK